MKEHPIIFSKEMVWRIVCGTKTQTRRVVRGVYPDPGSGPYGSVGDLLWVREAWRPIDDDIPVGKLTNGSTIYYRADYVSEAGEKWRPSIHMPRWASRITLEVVNIRVEWLQQISRYDSYLEGCSSVTQFIELWDSINSKRGYGWNANPMVWVIVFKNSSHSIGCLNVQSQISSR